MVGIDVVECLYVVFVVVGDDYLFVIDGLCEVVVCVWDVGFVVCVDLVLIEYFFFFYFVDFWVGEVFCW